MTSSLRNSLHRRNHKERSQLAHRSRLGLLEKHSDYVQRARDYHSKQDRLNRLKQKAADRNKDEFYFSMTKEKTKGGVHIKDRGNASLPIDIVKVLKTQDENYVRTMRIAGQKKIEKIKNRLTAQADLVNPASAGLEESELNVLKEAGIITRKSRKSKHIVFVENEEQAKQYVVDQKAPEPSNPSGTEATETGLGWKIPEKKERKKHNADESLDEEDGDEVEQPRKRQLKELSARLYRDKQLRYAERELEMQRLLMGKGGRRKLRGVEKVEGDEEKDDEDEDELDSRQGRSRKSRGKVVDEKLWKPRVYKWRPERKR